MAASEVSVAASRSHHCDSCSNHKTTRCKDITIHSKSGKHNHDANNALALIRIVMGIVTMIIMMLIPRPPKGSTNGTP